MQYLRALSNNSRYYYDGRVHIIPEFDGVRLMTNDTCEFVHKVASKLKYQGNSQAIIDNFQVLLKRYSVLGRLLPLRSFWTR